MFLHHTFYSYKKIAEITGAPKAIVKNVAQGHGWSDIETPHKIDDLTRRERRILDVKGVKIFLEHTDLTHEEIAAEARVNQDFVDNISCEGAWTDIEIPHELDGLTRRERLILDVKGIKMCLHHYPDLT